MCRAWSPNGLVSCILYMVISLGSGTSIFFPRCQNPYHGGPDNGTPNSGKPPHDKWTLGGMLGNMLHWRFL